MAPPGWATVTHPDFSDTSEESLGTLEPRPEMWPEEPAVWGCRGDVAPQGAWEAEGQGRRQAPVSWVWKAHGLPWGRLS